MRQKSPMLFFSKHGTRLTHDGCGYNGPSSDFRAGTCPHCKQTIVHAACRILRRVAMRPMTLDVTDGTVSGESRVEWLEDACRHPLFTDEEKRTGICRSCKSGWKTSDNYPISRIRADGE